MFSGTDWVVVLLALGTGIAGAIGAWVQHRKGPDDKEGEEAPRPMRKGLMTVAIAEDDRAWLSRAVARIEEALGDHGRTMNRALEDHGEKIDRQTDVLKRSTE